MMRAKVEYEVVEEQLFPCFFRVFIRRCAGNAGFGFAPQLVALTKYLIMPIKSLIYGRQGNQ